MDLPSARCPRSAERSRRSSRRSLPSALFFLAISQLLLVTSAQAAEVFNLPAALQQLPTQNRVILAPPPKATPTKPLRSKINPNTIDIDAVHYLIDSLTSVADNSNPAPATTGPTSRRQKPRSAKACDAILDSPAAQLGDAITIDSGMVRK